MFPKKNLTDGKKYDTMGPGNLYFRPMLQLSVRGPCSTHAIVRFNGNTLVTEVLITGDYFCSACSPRAYTFNIYVGTERATVHGALEGLASSVSREPL